MAYFYGSGSVFIGTRSADGKFEKGKIYHCPDFEIEVEDERIQHKNTSGAKRELDLDVSIETMPKVRIVIDEQDEEILALGLGGEATEVPTGASFSAKLFPSGIAVGNTLPVPGGYSNLESLTITDSAGSPATLTAGTHYTADLEKGLVTFLNLGAYTQPFKAAGAENDEFSVVSIGTDTKAEKFIRFSGVNVVDDDQAIHNIDLYRGSFKPTKVAGKQTGTDVASQEFDVPLLADPNAPFDENFGRYGRWLKG